MPKFNKSVNTPEQNFRFIEDSAKTVGIATLDDDLTIAQLKAMLKKQGFKKLRIQAAF